MTLYEISQPDAKGFPSVSVVGLNEEGSSSPGLQPWGSDISNGYERSIEGDLTLM